jgi:hypothetical protein
VPFGRFLYLALMTIANALPLDGVEMNPALVLWGKTEKKAEYTTNAPTSITADG